MKTATAEKAADTERLDQRGEASVEQSAKSSVAMTVTRPTPGPVFVTNGQREALLVKGGTVFVIGGEPLAFDIDTPVLLPAPMKVGADYFIRLSNNALIADEAAGSDLDGVLGGFHFAPGGNAQARAGGDDVPAINPWSCWDIGWRPVCADPRGMTAVCLDFRSGPTAAGRASAEPTAGVGGRVVWVDIYLLGTEPFTDGTSRYGVTIADGGSPPAKAPSGWTGGAGAPQGQSAKKTGGRYKKLDQPTAIEIYAAVGKSLLSPEEFFAAAFGVTEGTSVDNDPQKTGLDAARTSKWGLMQATGNMSTWGTDGDPDGQRQAWRFGGYWAGGGWAGSRCAVVGLWPGYSSEWLGARGRSDHLNPE